MTPRVSVLLPVRGGAAYLDAALDSLRAQTLEDLEVLVICDGADDGSVERARGHAAADGRVRVLEQPCLGIVAALERGRREARAPLLARMDADDVALPRRLELQVGFLERERLDACGCGVELVSDGPVGDGMRRYARWLNGLTTPELAARDVFVECPIAHPALLVRASALDAAGGYRDRGWPEDHDLLLRLWAGGARFCNAPQRLLRWRVHPGQASRSSPVYSREAFMRCRAHHLATTLARGRDVVVWGAGPVGKACAWALRGEGVSVAAFADVDPRKLGNRIEGVPVLSHVEAARVHGALAVGAVAGPAARERLRALAAAEGRRDGADFVAVA
jgi:GT2 family glycosyltransferase